MKIRLKKYFVYHSLLLCLWACKEHRDNESYKVSKDEEGNLQSEIHYISDSIIHGIAKYYYSRPANVLEDEFEYNNGKKDGWHKHYREDGTLESMVHYKNGLADGSDYRYYEDGIKIESEHYWQSGKNYGTSKWYYKNGQLELFNVTDFYGGVLYVIRFDEKGHKTNEQGVVFSPKYLMFYTNDIALINIKNPVKRGKQITFIISVAEPPQTKTKISMGELNKNDMIELPIRNGLATYKNVFTETGNYTLIAVGEIKDLNGNLIKKDSSSINIIVEN